MAGLYIKELLRDDVRQCLIVAPGGLVEQWQDELFFKFGLRFDLLTNQLIDANVNLNVFDTNPLLIARMDQLSRNEELQVQLKETEWDLIIVAWRPHPDNAPTAKAAGRRPKVLFSRRGPSRSTPPGWLILRPAAHQAAKRTQPPSPVRPLPRNGDQRRYHRNHAPDGQRRSSTFDGKKLFPERRAETVPYELTELEYSLYEQVTSYVREGMNRADKIGGKRKNTVGFALTVLQRRLASSPEAIYKSLVRRTERLERKKQEILNGTGSERELPIDLEGLDADDYNSEEISAIEEELLDAATAAQTVEELDAEP